MEKKKNHRWKNYSPDTGHSFCYMNPDMCCPIKGERDGGWGEKKTLARKIPHELDFHLLSQGGADGRCDCISVIMFLRLTLK